ncbi:MAG: alpha/beta fold hydrolase [Anaerolineae bacterium]|nr:MAG: alpha/beta fold hydrolase [Anaerolineae bacterium]
MSCVFWGLVGLLALMGGVIGALALYGARVLTRRRVPDPPVSPLDYGLAYKEVAFPSRDGLTLRGWFIPAALPRGTVIFCHGHAGSMDPDLRYVPAFRDRGYNVLLFDFRAHGRSDGQIVSMGSQEQRDLLGAVDFLQARGIERVGVLGFSMGGRVAISTAPHSEAIAAVVSDGGPVTLLESIIAGSRERGLPGVLALPVAWLTLWLAGRLVGCNLSEADAVYWVSKLAPRALFLIHGGRDPYVSTAAVEALFAAAGEPKELWSVPEADHRKVDEQHPDEYLARVIGFFDRYLAATMERVIEN